jgi:hypothetical protein
MNRIKNRLNALKNKPKENVATEVESKQILKKSFVHGSNVIFVNSASYKGMVGFIQEFFPAKYQVNVKEYSTRNIKNVNIGDKLPTETGLVTVEEISPEQYVIENLNGNLVNVNGNELERYVLYKESNVNNETDTDYKSKIEQLKETRDTKIVNEIDNKLKTANKTDQEYLVYIKNNLQQFPNILNKLTQDTKVQTSKIYNELITKVNIFLPKSKKINNVYTFKLARVVSDNNENIIINDTSIEFQSNVSDINKNLEKMLDLLNNVNFMQTDKSLYVGNIVETYYGNVYNNSIFGKLVKIEQEKAKVSQLKTIMLTSNQIEKIDKNTLVIKKGDFKSSEVYPFTFIEPYLSVLLSNGIKVYNHLVKNNSGELINKYVSPNDVFYMDIKLINGNYAQVVGKTDDNKIAIKEKKDYKFQDNVISNNEIEEYLAGFKWTEKLEEPVSLLKEETSIDNETTETTDPENEDSEIDGYQEDGEHNEEETSDIQYTTEPEMKESYKDKERMTTTQIELTPTQNKFKNFINKIFEIYNLNGDDYNLDNIINFIETTLKSIDKMAEKDNIEQNIYFSGYKFILASIMYYEIKKYKTIKFSTFVTKVLPILFGKNMSISILRDIIDSNKYLYTLYENLNYLKEYYKSKPNHLDTIKNWIKENDLQRVIMDMMEISVTLVSHIGNYTETTTQNLPMEFYPLGEGIYENNTWIPRDKSNDNRKIISFNEIIRNGLPNEIIRNGNIEYKIKIIFKPEILQILTRIKNEIDNKMLTANKNDKIHLKYIKNNLQRLPYALKESTGEKQKYLNFIYNQLLEEMKVINNRKQDKIDSIIIHNELMKTKRNVVNTDSKFQKILEKYEEIDYPEDLSLAKLQKICEELKCKKSGTKQELIHRIEMKLGLIEPVLTRSKFLAKGYKNIKGVKKEIWTLPELVEMADELDIDIFEDSTKEEIYEKINDYFISQEYDNQNETFTIIGETNEKSPDQIMDSAVENRIVVLGKNFNGNSFKVVFKSTKKIINKWITENEIKAKVYNGEKDKINKRQIKEDPVDIMLNEAINTLKKQKIED